MNPRVRRVKPEDDYRLRITFTNGEVRVFDVSPYLKTGVFRELLDPAVFRSVRPAFGTIQWGGGQDFCPDTLYEGSVPLGNEQADAAREKPSTYRISRKKK
ncbi:MAG TPA: DUF2442 domain-containing protein [bacterium]